MKEKTMQKAPTPGIVRLGAVLALSAALAATAQAQAPSQSQGGMMDDMASGKMQDGTVQDGGMMGDGMPGMTRGGGMMRRMMHGMRHHGRMMERMGYCLMGGGSAAYTQGRLAFIKAGLAITSEQKGAWEAYASAVKKNFDAIEGVHDAMMKVTQTASPAGRLDAHIAALEATAATLKELKPALAALYDALSDEQKKKADKLLTGMACMM